MYLGLKIGDICIEDIQFSLYCVDYNALYILEKETMGDYAKSDFNGTTFWIITTWNKMTKHILC